MVDQFHKRSCRIIAHIEGMYLQKSVPAEKQILLRLHSEAKNREFF